MKLHSKIILDAMGGDGIFLITEAYPFSEENINIRTELFRSLFKKYRFHDRDLVILSIYLSDFKSCNLDIKPDRNHGRKPYDAFNFLNEDYWKQDSRFIVLKKLKNIKLTGIRFDYQDSQGRPNSFSVDKETAHHLQEMILYDALFGERDPNVYRNDDMYLKFLETYEHKVNPAFIKKTSHKPYGSFLQHWIKTLNQYLQDKIFKKKDRYFFIGQFLKISGMPLVYLQGKNESEEIPEKNYFDHIRKLI